MDQATSIKEKGLGSYFYGSFNDNDEELIRLKKQASIGIEFEKTIWDKLDVKNAAKVLDIGCGPGVVSGELTKYCSSAQVLGVDKNELMIEQANRFIANESDRLSFQQGDIYDLDLDGRKFDFIYSRFLFQHLAEPVKAMKNLYNHLDDGGKVCILDVDDAYLGMMPRTTSFDNYIAKSQEFQSSYGGDRFVGSKLADLYKEAGFTNVQSNVITVTTSHIPVNHFLDMIINYKFQLFRDLEGQEKETISKWRDDILNTGKLPHAWGAIGLFYTVAEK